jgi:hypothetical protein
LDPKDSDFEPTLKDLMSQLRQHIKGEEKDDLPVLEDALPASEAESLAGSFGRTKMFVPTRYDNGLCFLYSDSAFSDGLMILQEPP